MGNAHCTSIIRFFLDKESDRTVFMSGIQFRICLDTNKWKVEQGWISWKSEMQCWGGEILHFMLISYPDGIMLEPFVSTGQQREVDIPGSWDSRNRNGRRKSRLHELHVDDMALEKIGQVESWIFCKERTFAQNEHESDLESCVWL